MLRRLTIAAVALLALALPGASVRPALAVDIPTPTPLRPLRILTVGDSITAHCGDVPPAGYCGPLGTMLDQAGVSHVFINRAVAGTDCDYTASNIQTWLTADQPDLVLLDCGTNNVPGSQASQDLMAAQWRTIVETIHATPVKQAISFIGYSNPVNASTFGSSLPTTEGVANDVIYREWQYEIGRPGWATGFSGLADFQRLPGNLTYLDSGGIHPIALGYQAMAAIWYRSLEATMGWPDLVTEPCGMWGYRPGGTPRQFVQCTGTTP